MQLKSLAKSGPSARILYSYELPQVSNMDLYETKEELTTRRSNRNSWSTQNWSRLKTEKMTVTKK